MDRGAPARTRARYAALFARRRASTGRSRCRPSRRTAATSSTSSSSALPERDALKAPSRRAAASATRSTIRCRSICSRASPISATARGDFPHAERAAGESLAIPIYGELTVEQQQTVVDAIAEFVHAQPAAAAPLT